MFLAFIINIRKSKVIFDSQLVFSSENFRSNLHNNRCSNFIVQFGKKFFSLQEEDRVSILLAKISS